MGTPRMCGSSFLVTVGWVEVGGPRFAELVPAFVLPLHFGDVSEPDLSWWCGLAILIEAVIAFHCPMSIGRALKDDMMWIRWLFVFNATMPFVRSSTVIDRPFG